MDIFLQKRVCAISMCGRVSSDKIHVPVFMWGVYCPESLSTLLGMFVALMQDDVGQRIFNRQFVNVSDRTSSLQSSSYSQLGPPIEAANGSEVSDMPFGRCDFRRPWNMSNVSEPDDFTKRNSFVIPGSFQRWVNVCVYIYIYSLRIYCFTHMRCQAPSSFLQEQKWRMTRYSVPRRMRCATRSVQKSSPSDACCWKTRCYSP